VKSCQQVWQDFLFGFLMSESQVETFPRWKPMRRCTRAFTLIELLIVLCVIAILAGLLLPTLATARAKARAVVCLSNLKQIDAAVLMYTQDYDERFPTVGRSVQDYGNPETGDMVVRVQPYLRDYQVFFCPDRTATYGTDTWTDAKAYSWNPQKRELGYGSNFGLWSIMDSTGLFRGMYADENACGLSLICAVGHDASGVTAPAQFVTMGDTFDYPYYSLSLQYQQTDGSSTGNIRHLRFWNYAYADGHVKPVPIAPYAVKEEWFFTFTVMPTRAADIHAMCIDEDAMSVIYSVPCQELAREIIEYRKEL
jgi:prepilin-type N-terminal cleavage/methylation domain-containing protein/prepilin-type processing-associated H-X9-DG protein